MIDTATNTVSATVGVGFGPIGVAITPPKRCEIVRVTVDLFGERSEVCE